MPNNNNKNMFALSWRASFFNYKHAAVSVTGTQAFKWQVHERRMQDTTVWQLSNTGDANTLAQFQNRAILAQLRCERNLTGFRFFVLFYVIWNFCFAKYNLMVLWCLLPRIFHEYTHTHARARALPPRLWATFYFLPPPLSPAVRNFLIWNFYLTRNDS